MYCKNCREKIAPDATFCPHCGVSVEPEFWNRKQKRSGGKKKGKTAIIVIAAILLLGLFGNIIEYIEQNPIKPSNLIVQNGKNTIMIYMDGSDIESGENRAVYGCMTDNIRQSLASGIDTSKNNVLFYTGGCEKWHDFNIPSDKDSIYIIENGNLTLLEQREPHSMSDSNTLEYFLSYCTKNYPAQQYSLIMADHGGGPNVGLCVDINTKDVMTLSELANALKRSGFTGDSKLETIMFDACLMASVEVAAVVKDYAKYMVASENSSLSAGCDYSFLSAFNTAQSGAEVGESYVEKFYQASLNEVLRLRCYGLFDITFSCIDLSAIDNVISCADAFFNVAANDMETMYPYFSRIRESTEGVHDEGGDPNVSTQFYYDLIDLYDFVSNHKTTYQTEAQNLLYALDNAIVYNRSSSYRMNGLTFYSPFKSDLSAAYSKVCFSNGYSDYISAFMKEKNGDTSFNMLFSSISPTTSGIENRYTASMDLTDEQVREFSYGEYFVFAKPHNITNNDGSKYALQEDEYMFVSNGFDVTLNGKTLAANVNGKGCYVSSGNGDLLCPVYTAKSGGNLTNYALVSLSYVPEIKGETEDEELESLVEAIENMKLDVGKLYLNISGDKVDIGALYLISDMNTYQRSPLSMDYYNEISFETFAKKTSYDEKSNLLPFNKWTSLTNKMLSHSHKTKDISMKMKSLDQNADYYVMLVAHDIYGNANCSNIVPLDVQ